MATIFDYVAGGLSQRERAQYMEVLDDKRSPKRKRERAKNMLRMDDEARSANDPRHTFLKLEQDAESA